jgi:Cupin domain
VIAFRPFELTHAARIDLHDGPFLTVVHSWVDQSPFELPAGGTHFGFVHTGPAEFGCASGTFCLGSGMYFAAPGPAQLQGGSGLVITRAGFRGFFQVGGPVEDTGRLRYIDGCTDSLLIPPVLLGDPCLNLLHIPPNTRQTAHTHPSVRIGVIVRGTGECVTPGRRFPLSPGLGFVIAAGALHSFHTDQEPLLVIAYHPDSDFGPTHEFHPMVNRTILPRESQP